MTQVLPPWPDGAPDAAELVQVVRAHRGLRLVRFLGRGGMGAVFEVEERETGARRALKVLTGRSPRALLRFKREFRSVADLAHPNLVRLFELWRVEDHWGFTMELVDGPDLGRLIGAAHDQDTISAEDLPPAGEPSAPPVPGTPLEPAVLIGVLDQIAAGLAHLHQHGVVHGDLKPSNVLVGAGRRVRLTDFGLAEPVAGRAQAPGLRAGTPAFLAPEVTRSGTGGTAADLYALGALAFQLATGHTPRGGGQAPPWRAPRIDERVRGMPPELVDLCAELMAEDPRRRPHLSDVRRALTRLGRVTTHPNLRRTVVVGRAAELARMAVTLSDAVRGVRRRLVLCGPAGIGKTTLLAEAVHTARRSRFTVLRGAGRPGWSAPYVIVAPIVASLVTDWMPDATAELRRAIRAVRRIHPAAPEGRSDDAAESTADELGPWARRELEDGLVVLLERAQREAPVLVVLDNLEAVDADSAALLGRVLPRLGGRIAILAAADDARTSVRRTLGENFERMEIAPLTPADALRLAHTVAGGPHWMSPSEVPAVPLLGRLHALVGRGAPSDLAGLVDRCAGLLGPAAREVLDLLAVADVPLAPDMATELSGLPPDRYRCAVGELMTVGLAEPLGAGDIGPAHPEVAGAVRARLSGARQTELHRRLAQRLEEHAPAEHERLLRHWTAVGEPRAVARASRGAACDASRRLASHRAAELFERLARDTAGAERARTLASAAQERRARGSLHHARALLERAVAAIDGPPAWDAVGALRVRLLGELADAANRVGDPAAAARAIREAERTLGPVRLGSPPGLTRRLLDLPRALGRRQGPSGTHTPSPRAAAAAGLYDTVWGTVLPLWPERAARMAAIAEQAGLAIDDPPIVQRAVAHRVVSDLLCRAVSARSLARATADLERAEALGGAHALAAGRASVALGRATLTMARDPTAACDAFADLAACELGHGRVATDAPALARGLRLAACWLAGDPAAAETISAGELASGTKDFITVALALALQVWARSLRGDAVGALGPARALADHVRAVPDSWLNSLPGLCEAWMSLARGDAEGALLVLSDTARGTSDPIAAAALPASELALEACLLAVRTGTAGSLEHRWAEGLSRRLARGVGFGVSVWGLRAQALLALAAGDTARARQLTSRALIASARSGPLWRWRCIGLACDVGMAGSSLEAEGTSLRAGQGFLAPPGWALRPKRPPGTRCTEDA